MLDIYSLVFLTLIKFLLQFHLPGSQERIVAYVGEYTYITMQYTVTQDELGPLSSMPCNMLMKNAYDDCFYEQVVESK